MSSQAAFPDNIVVCVLEDIRTQQEDVRVAAGARGEVIDGAPGVACELFFLDAAPLTAPTASRP
ncbi:MAG: hypothetical protein M3Z27_05095 [Actinomycetota bacterium]|nr:hypothetical protein [Actinomycetota bacterium]